MGATTTAPRASLIAMTTEDEIRLVLDLKAAALIERQAEHLDALIHNDFLYVNAGGQSFDKVGYIEAYCISGKVVFLQQQFADLVIKLFDNFVVATFSIHDELSVEERRISGRYRSLCVFSQTSGQWLWTAGQTMTTGAA